MYARMGITMFISLYTTRLILNALGAEDFGIFNVVGGAIAMMGFLNAAMTAATQRFMSYAEGEGKIEKQKSIFNVAIVLHFFIAIVLGIVLLIAGYFFFNSILTIPEERMYAAKLIYYFMIVSTMLTVMTVPYQAVLNAHENMLYFAIVGVIESLLKLAVALIVVNTILDKLIMYGVLMAGISLTVMLIMRVYTHKHYSECVYAPRKYWDKDLMKEMTSFAGWSLFGSSSGIISGYGTNIILNNFFGPVLNAANGICGQLNGQLMAFSNNMMKAVNPVIVKSEGQGNRNQMFKVTFTAGKLSVLLYSFFAIPFILETSFILKLWLKEVPPYTEIFLQLMFIQVLIEEITMPLGTSISAIGKIKQYNIIVSIILYSEIFLLFLAYIIGFPPQTLRIVAIIGAFGITLYKVWYCKYYCNMPLVEFITDVFMRSALVIILTLLIGYILQSFFDISLARMIIVTFVSFLSFGVLSYLLGLNQQERLRINDFILQRLKKILKHNYD